MISIKSVTAATAVALVVVLTADVVSAGPLGNVILFEHRDFGGASKSVNVDEGKCYDVGCFNDKASSSRWNLAHTTSRNKQAKVTFYTDGSCRGTARTWDTNAPGQPSNFQLDGINDQVSSFVVWDDAYTMTG